MTAPRLDAWSRPLALLAWLRRHPTAAARVPDDAVPPGAPRAVLLAIRAFPSVTRVLSAEAACRAHGAAGVALGAYLDHAPADVRLATQLAGFGATRGLSTPAAVVEPRRAREARWRAALDVAAARSAPMAGAA